MRKHASKALLLFLTGSFLVMNFIWLSMDKGHFAYDSYRHFFASLRIYENLRALSLDAYPPVLDIIQLHPPLVAAVTAPFFLLLGPHQDVAAMAASLIFLPILTGSVFAAGARIAGARCGLLAAALVCLYPAVFNQMKVYMLDLPLTAMTATACYFLMASDGLRRQRETLLFALSCGLGLLIKESFLIFIAGPVCVMLWRRLRVARTEGTARLWHQAVIAAAVTLAVCGYYYLFHTYRLLDKVASSNYVATWPYALPDSGLLPRIFRGMLWYLWGFINWQASFLSFALLLCALPFFIRLKVQDKWILAAWIVVPWVLVSWLRPAVDFNMEVTGIRYTMPFLPAVALVTACGITAMPSVRLRRALATAALLLGSAQMLMISFPLVPRDPIISVPVADALSREAQRYKLLPRRLSIFDGGVYAVSGSDSGSRPVNMVEYRIALMRVVMMLKAAGAGRDSRVIMLPDAQRLWELRYQMYRDGLMARLDCDWNYLRAQMQRRGATAALLVSEADYVIDSETGYQGEPYLRKFVDEARLAFASVSHRFILLGSVESPDYDLRIYKRKSGHGE